MYGEGVISDSSRTRSLASLLGAIGVVAASLVTIAFAGSPVRAASVTSGRCTAVVNDAAGVNMAVTSSNDCVLSFATVGTNTWTVPSSVTSVSLLLIGGGGGGGFDIGGGGGAGGFREVVALQTTPNEVVSLTVGAGGLGDTSRGQPCVGANGTDTSIVLASGTLTSIGGGGGGGQDGGGACSTDGIAGASGGGGGVGLSWPKQGGAGSYSTDGDANTFGNPGGNASTVSYYAGGGGGGANNVGGNGTGNGSGAVGGAGGNGKSSNISGVDVMYAGGGAGGFFQSGTRGLGGAGGGGNGGTNATSPEIGTDGLGGGGGGGGIQNGVYGQGARGGNGVVIIRYTPAAEPTNSLAPVISGTTQTGSTLTTTDGTWTSSPTSYSYQWKRSSTSGGVYSNIPLAVSRTYVLTDTDIDKYIKVSVAATNSIGTSLGQLSAATAQVSDLSDSVVPTATTPVATASGFTFTISNYSTLYSYSLTTTSGSVSRTTDGVAVTDLSAGESASVTVRVTRPTYKSATKTVTGTAIPAATTTTAAPALSIVIQAPTTTVAQGQVSVATIAPGATSPTVSTTTTVVRPATVATTSTIARSMTSTTVGPPDVAKVAAGESSVLLDGANTDATISRENNQMVVTAGSVNATLSGIDKQGKTLPLDSGGSVHLSAGDVIKVSVGGFQPDSEVDVWLFSTPTRLGSAVVGADGKVTESFILPSGIKSGSHRVAVVAKLPNGKSATFTLGILVGEISQTSTLTRVLIAIPITLAIGFGFLLPTQLRRRRRVKA